MGASGLCCCQACCPPGLWPCHRPHPTPVTSACPAHPSPGGARVAALGQGWKKFVIPWLASSPPPAGYSLSPSLLFPGSFSPGKSSFRFSQDRTKKGFEVPRGTRQHSDLPSSLHPQHLSISPSFFFLQTPSCHNPGSHNSLAKHNQLLPTKYGFKMVPCSSPDSRRESFGSFRAWFCLCYVPCCCRCCAGARGPSRRLPAAVTTQPLLSYTWCLLEGGKQFWALTAFFLPWQLFRALRSEHCAHDCVWLVTKQMLQKAPDGDRGSFNFLQLILWPLAMV